MTDEYEHELQLDRGAPEWQTVATEEWVEKKLDALRSRILLALIAVVVCQSAALIFALMQ